MKFERSKALVSLLKEKLLPITDRSSVRTHRNIFGEFCYYRQALRVWKWVQQGEGERDILLKRNSRIGEGAMFARSRTIHNRTASNDSLAGSAGCLPCCPSGSVRGPAAVFCCAS